MTNANSSSIFDVIRDISQKADRLIKDPKLDLPLSESDFCIVCKMPRIDSDITGVTCGNPRCFHEVGEMAFHQAELEKDIKEREEELKEDEVQIDEAIRLLGNVYSFLGMNKEELNTDNLGKKCEHLAIMCEAVENRVRDLVAVMAQLSQKIESKANH